VLAQLGLMCIGALMVAIGVLAAAAADRIRGVTISAPKRKTTDAVACERSPRSGADSSVTDAHKRLRADVIRALTQSGYSHAVAVEAVDDCKGSEQSSLESWIRAALKRAMAGAAKQTHAAKT
jgi:hypothetical protein